MRLIRVAVCVTVLALSAGSGGAAPPSRLPREAREALASFARSVLAGEVDSVTPAMLKKMPEALRGTGTEQLFVTLFRDRAPAIRFSSRKSSLVEAAFAAMAKARTLPSFDFYNYGDAANVGLLFERVTERYTVPPERWFAQLSFMSLGVHGIAVTQDDRAGALPPSEALLSDLDTRDDFIGRLCASLRLYPKPPKVQDADALIWDKKKTRVELLGVETFLSRGPGYGTFDLYRMNHLAVEPWKDKLAVASRMGNVLANRQTPEGAFFRRYDARRGRYTTAGYDILEHCSAIVALSELGAATNDKRYLDAAGRAVDYLKKQFRTENPPGGTPFMYVVYDKEAKLGAAAMAIVALERYSSLTGGIFHDADMKLLGRFLLRQQFEDGRFLNYYRYDKDVPYSERPSSRFPGQAAWALAVLDRRFNEEVWRKAAASAAAYLITRREQDMHWSEPPPDLWLAAALHKMSTPVAVAEYLKYATAMGECALKRQKLGNVAPDMIGSFEGDPEGSVRGAAARARLIAEVLTFTTGKVEERKAALAACRRALDFVRLNELRPNNTFYLVEPEQAYGMVRESPFKNDVCLDTTCDVIEALLWMDRIEKMEQPR